MSVALPEIAADQDYDGIGLEWFTDEEHLLRYEAWLRTAAGQDQERLLGEAIELAASPVVVTTSASSAAPTGWSAAGRRAPRSSSSWHRHPGRRADPPAVPRPVAKPGGKDRRGPIPEAFRGLAYVQNHPRAMAGRDWAYDAVNEVYFDDAESLLARIEYFERELSDRGT